MKPAKSHQNIAQEFAEAEQTLRALKTKRAWNRRNFLTGIGMAGAATAGASVLAACSSSGHPVVAAGPSETDILNFALNLEYLEAQFYLYATTGAGLPSSDTTAGNGSGQTGTVSGGQQVGDFSSYPASVQQVAAEIAADEQDHVVALRTVLGSDAVAMPNINFSALGIDLSKTVNFLAAARLFEDVGVTAYAGAAQYLTSTNLTYAAQILAVESYHSGNLRLQCIQLGIVSPKADPIDSPPAQPSDYFFTTPNATQSGTPNGFAPTRNTSQVLAIVYGAIGTPAPSGTSSGGVFPNGLSGTITTV